MIICLLTVTILHKSCEILIMYIFHESPFRLFCNSVGYQFEKSIQVLKNQVWNFDVM